MKTSDLDARHKLQEIAHQRAKFQKPRQGTLPLCLIKEWLVSRGCGTGELSGVGPEPCPGTTPSRAGLPYTSSYQTAGETLLSTPWSCLSS